TTGRRTRSGHQTVAGGATLEVHHRASHSDAKSGRQARSDVTTVSADRPRVASPILLAKLAYSCIIGGRQGRPERFVHPRHDDEQRLAHACGIKVQQTVQAIVVTTLAATGFGAVDPHFEPAGHVAVHGLPVASTSNSMRRGACNGYQHRGELRTHARWASHKKLPTQYTRDQR